VAIPMQPTQAHVSSLMWRSTSIQGAIRRRRVNQHRHAGLDAFLRLWALSGIPSMLEKARALSA
jgi:hypothetical protein